MGALVGYSTGDMERFESVKLLNVFFGLDSIQCRWNSAFFCKIIIIYYEKRNSNFIEKFVTGDVQGILEKR